MVMHCLHERGGEEFCLLLLILAITVQMMQFFFSPAQADSASFPPQAFKMENKLVFTFSIEQNRLECGKCALCSPVPRSGSLAFKSDLFDLHVVVRLPAHNSASIHVFIAYRSYRIQCQRAGKTTVSIKKKNPASDTCVES